MDDFENIDFSQEGELPVRLSSGLPWDLTRQKSFFGAFLSYLFFSIIIGFSIGMIGALVNILTDAHLDYMMIAVAVGVWAWLSPQRQMSNIAGVACFAIIAASTILGVWLSFASLIYILMQPMTDEDDFETVGEDVTADFSMINPQASGDPALEALQEKKTKDVFGNEI